MRSLRAACVILMLVVVCAAASAAAADNALVIPEANAGSGAGLVLLAQVSVRIREAELNRLTCSANPDAELEYQNALRAMMDGRYQSGIIHLEAADKVLKVEPVPDLP
jgi:hypothetical protein